MKPVLVFRNVAHETMGTLRTALDDAGLPFRYVDLFAEVPAHLDVTQAAGLIVLGGPMNVDETDRYPFLAREVDWMRQAVEAEVPVLGVCLGSQLLAKALGARVRANGIKEIGWYRINLAPEAATDRLFRTCWEDVEGDTRQVTVFQWHGDTFDLPDGAVHLAASELCSHQAFRFGRSAYGLQFHLEMTREMIDDWLGEAGNRGELAQLDYIDPEEIRGRTRHELPAMQSLAQRMFGQFAALCRR